MALKDHKIPGNFTYAKLSDYPDKEKIPVYGAGITSGGKYGDQAYLIGAKNIRITLPARYTDYIRELLLDDDALRELADGMIIEKNSYEYDAGKSTAVFEWI